jgi:hypothetical protein
LLLQRKSKYVLLTSILRMRNLHDNRRRCRRWNQKTSGRHFSSVDVAQRKRSKKKTLRWDLKNSAFDAWWYRFW